MKADYAEGQDLYAEVGEVDEEEVAAPPPPPDIMASFNGYSRVGAAMAAAGQQHDPAPYATTTLALQNNNRIVRTVVRSDNSINPCGISKIYKFPFAFSVFFCPERQHVHVPPAARPLFPGLSLPPHHLQQRRGFAQVRRGQRQRQQRQQRQQRPPGRPPHTSPAEALVVVQLGIQPPEGEQLLLHPELVGHLPAAARPAAAAAGRRRRGRLAAVRRGRRRVVSSRRIEEENSEYLTIKIAVKINCYVYRDLTVHCTHTVACTNIFSWRNKTDFFGEIATQVLVREIYVLRQ